MRTTLDLPKELLDEAVRVSPHRTKTGVIVAALDAYVRTRRLAALKRFRGTVDLDLDLDTLRRRR
jgi:hypothetical protein